MILAKPGFMVASLWIQALLIFYSFWIFVVGALTFLPNCLSYLWASHDCVGTLTPRLHTNAPKHSWILYAMQALWLPNRHYSISEISRIDCSSQFITQFADTLSVVIPTYQLSESSKQSRTSFTCSASHSPECLPLTYGLLVKENRKLEVHKSHQIEATLYKVFSYDWYNSQWQIIWLIHMLISTHPMLYWLCIVLQLLFNCFDGQGVFPIPDIAEGTGEGEYKRTA
jgi:hypothetical protein